MDDELTETAVQSALTTRWLGRHYHYFDTIGSTNDRLKEMVAAGDGQHPPAGTLLLTDYQSRGRGRLDRRWQAPPGSSLLLSVLFRPDWPAEQAQWLTMMASLAAADAIETATDLTVGVKWPNDLLVAGDGDWRKVSGLLLEGVLGDDGRLQSAILGIGINVNIPPPAIAAVGDDAGHQFDDCLWPTAVATGAVGRFLAAVGGRLRSGRARPFAPAGLESAFDHARRKRPGDQFR
jgi:biotin-(acetyl-CoA carboxylase) ligase